VDLAGGDIAQAERVALLTEAHARRDRLAASRTGMGRLDGDRRGGR
jgi:hypothetical protein